MVPNTHYVVATIPLGLLSITAALKKECGCDIQIIDARCERLSDQAIARRLKAFVPDVIGITGLSTESTEVQKLARLAKTIMPDSTVVVGGAYATSSPEFIIADPSVDFVVMGEGEMTICSLIQALAANGDPSGIRGLAFKNKGTAVINKPQELIKDLDALPFPAWDNIGLERYFRNRRHHCQTQIPFSERIVPLFTSRGCPFACIFCHNIFGKKLRLRSVENVLQEIELLVNRYKVEEIEICDDNFNSDAARAKQICEEIVRRGIKIRLAFPNALRIDTMDEELIVKLRQAGARVLHYSIESASPVIQKSISKHLDLEKARKIIRFSLQQGLFVYGYFMFGFPGETKEDMLATIRFAKNEGFHAASFFYVTPYPGTRLFDMVNAKEGDVHNKQHYYLKLSQNVSAASDAELKQVWAKAYREFYFRPSQIAKIWNAVPKNVLFKIVFRHLLPLFERSGIFDIRPG